MTKAARRLIVNADDFGQSAGVNRGIIAAHQRGIVTSASLMVRWRDAVEAAEYSRANPDLSVGIHLDFGEWAYRDDQWIALYEVVRMDDEPAVARELKGQLDAFRNLVGQEPTHVDSHQHVHLREPLRSIVVAESRKLGLPLRHLSGDIRHCGDFYGQTAEGASLPNAVSVDALRRILSTLPAGVTELGCHPGEGDDLETMYRSERAAEITVLCHPVIRTVIHSSGIQLCSFADTGARSTAHGVPEEGFGVIS